MTSELKDRVEEELLILENLTRSEVALDNPDNAMVDIEAYFRAMQLIKDLWQDNQTQSDAFHTLEVMFRVLFDIAEEAKEKQRIAIEALSDAHHIIEQCVKIEVEDENNIFNCLEKIEKALSTIRGE